LRFRLWPSEPARQRPRLRRCPSQARRRIVPPGIGKTRCLSDAAVLCWAHETRGALLPRLAVESCRGLSRARAARQRVRNGASGFPPGRNVNRSPHGPERRRKGTYHYRLTHPPEGQTDGSNSRHAVPNPHPGQPRHRTERRCHCGRGPAACAGCPLRILRNGFRRFAPAAGSQVFLPWRPDLFPGAG